MDDLDAYTERIKKVGGKLLVEKAEIPEVGFMALFEYRDGRVLEMRERFE